MLDNPTVPPIGKKCDDCKCCLATVKAGDDWICWECDEGKPCKGKIAGARAAASPKPEPAPVYRAVPTLPAVPPLAQRKPAVVDWKVQRRANRISEETRAAIAEADEGTPHRKLAQRFGVSEGSVDLIRRKAKAQRAQAAEPLSSSQVADPPAPLPKPATDVTLYARKGIIQLPAPVADPPSPATIQPEEPMTVSRKPRPRIPEETRKAIIAADPTISHTQLARQYGITDVSVYGIRKQAGIVLSKAAKRINARVPHKRAKAAKPAKNASAKKQPKPSTAIVPQLAAVQPGRVAISPFVIELEGVLDEQRLDTIFGRLAVNQKAVAIKAAIQSLLA